MRGGYEVRTRGAGMGMNPLVKRVRTHSCGLGLTGPRPTTGYAGSSYPYGTNGRTRGQQMPGCPGRAELFHLQFIQRIRVRSGKFMFCFQQLAKNPHTNVVRNVGETV